MNKIKEFLVTVSIGGNFKTREGDFYSILVAEGAIIFILRVILFTQFFFIKNSSSNSNIINEGNFLISRITSYLIITAAVYFVIDRGYIMTFRKRNKSRGSYILFLVFLLLIIGSSIYLATSHMSPFMRGLVATDVKQPYSYLLILAFSCFVILELFPIIGEYSFERQRKKEALDEKNSEKWRGYNDENLKKNQKQHKKTEEINMEMPKSIRVYFHQYLTFFKEYVKLAKGEEIDIEILENKNGIQVKVNLDSKLSLNTISSWLGEYINYTKQNISGLRVNFEKEASTYEADLLIAKLENQISNLQNNIRILKLENQQLKMSNSFLDKTAYNITTPMISRSAVNYDGDKYEQELMQLAGDGNLKEAIEKAIIYYQEIDREGYNELIIQSSKLKNLERQIETKKISIEQYEIARSEIKYAVLNIIEH
jgi:hypothetical protein